MAIKKGRSVFNKAHLSASRMGFRKATQEDTTRKGAVPAQSLLPAMRGEECVGDHRLSTATAKAFVAGVVIGPDGWTSRLGPS